MSQTSIASYFNTRKRAANGDSRSAIKSKVFLSEVSSLSSSHPNELLTSAENAPRSLKAGNSSECGKYDLRNVPKIQAAPAAAAPVKTRRASRVRKGSTDTVTSVIAAKKVKGEVAAAKAVETTKQLTPQIELPNQIVAECTPPVSALKTAESIERSLKTPTKNPPKNAEPKPEQIKALVRKELTFEDVKNKVSRSAKLQELKASLARIQELEKVRKEQEQRNKLLKEASLAGPQSPNTINLKEFKEIELEVLTSPKRGLKTPTKLISAATPDKNQLLSPKITIKPKKLLFSPTKDGSPSKLIVPPAYQRFENLAQISRSSLQMPYKYRNLIEMFKCLDSICAMFYNRKEVITFKKLKPAMQRMLRKNFDESHLAQIKKLYPEAFNFTLSKMRNYGSTSKQDYYQLIIAPNVGERRRIPIMTTIDEDDVLKSAEAKVMNPQVILERQQRFYNILLNNVKDEHEKFLKSLDPPIIIAKSKVTRWHPEFDLENCPDIERAPLPQPPNVEKYSSAKDILSTARNLFTSKNAAAELADRLRSTELVIPPPEEPEPTVENPAADLLKNVPKSLLEKIRAKQAAKARDAMTRCPSQDREAIKYSRLPKLAGHLRNVFVTERKNVLPLELVLKKIENSYQINLAMRDIEAHLRLIAKECPNWIDFHEIRKTIYLKIDRNADFNKVVSKLEDVANGKSK